MHVLIYASCKICWHSLNTGLHSCTTYWIQQSSRNVNGAQICIPMSLLRYDATARSFALALRQSEHTITRIEVCILLGFDLDLGFV